MEKKTARVEVVEFQPCITLNRLSKNIAQNKTNHPTILVSVKQQFSTSKFLGTSSKPSKLFINCF
jgi:hypothetical protein